MFANQTALVVDDSVSVSQIVCHLLRDELKFGKLINATNGAQGLDMFQTEQVDWIFSDFEMPQMNGLELLTAVRNIAKGKQVPFILMTSHADKDTLTKVVTAGATDFIAKPFNPATFIQKIQRIAAAGERRVAERVQTNRPSQGRILFSPAAVYKAEVLNVSATGCLLRTPPFREGGTIYDIAELSLELDGRNNVSGKGILVRQEACRSEAANKSIQAAFHFLELDNASQHAIQAFLSQHNAPVTERV